MNKNDGSLRQCIEYCALNAQTVKYRLPLPLVPAALEQLRGVHILTKLDLRNLYKIIWIRESDKWKTILITVISDQATMNIL